MQADQDVYEAGPAARFKHGAAAGDSDCSQGKIYGGSEAGIHERIETQDLKPGSSSSWSRAEVLNWPNAISFARLLSGPLLVGMILQGFLRAALVGLALAGASDWLDGFVARKLGISSVLGSYLDPLADKVLVGSIALSMAYAGLLNPALVALVVARDAVLLAGSIFYLIYTLGWQWSGWVGFLKIDAGEAEKIEPLYISKVNTALQLALVGVAVMQPALNVVDTYLVVPILSWSVAATTSLSWLGYVWVYVRRLGVAKH
jgi:cardiolipin synthase